MGFYHFDCLGMDLDGILSLDLGGGEFGMSLAGLVGIRLEFGWNHHGD